MCVCVFSVTNVLSKCCFQETALTIEQCGSRYLVMYWHSTSRSLRKKNTQSQSDHKPTSNHPTPHPPNPNIYFQRGVKLRTCTSPRLVPMLRVLPSSLQHRDEMDSLPVGASKDPTFVHVSAFQMCTQQPSAKATVLLQLQSRRFESEREQMSTEMIDSASFKKHFLTLIKM